MLQCLFSNEGFRKEILACPEPARGAHVIGQLRSVFALLQAGRQAVVDPSEFAKELELETGVQQDGQEFMKLLLQFVERAMGASADHSARRLVSRHFRGLCSFQTVCRTCQLPSDASRKLVDFYELVRRIILGSTPRRPLLRAVWATAQRHWRKHFRFWT